MIILAKKNAEDDSKVFIGRKKSMNYVLAAMMVINEDRPVRLLARGRSISKAVDVAEILNLKKAGGKPDPQRSAVRILQDWQSGKIK